MSLVLRRDYDSGPNDFWLVYRDDHERPVGRIYRNTAPHGSGEEWFWGLAFPYTRNEPQPFYGKVPTQAEAMAKFRECWERKPREHTTQNHYCA